MVDTNPARVAALTQMRALNHFSGHASLYRASHPVRIGYGETRHVIVATTNREFEGPRTYIFPASGRGKLLPKPPICGYRATSSHAEAIADAGWTVAA